jgi:uncharacterized protein YjbI with pentapeptide repeats
LADLSGANLKWASLPSADLSNANLNGANLQKADLSSAYLSGANLQKADLSMANLSLAKLNGAKLFGARLYESVFGNSDLRDAAGLSQCVFEGPCILDLRTIQRSGRLPLPFLRGCGLPDLVIEYLPSLLNEPIQFYSCFISYSRTDQHFAERLHADLQASGVRCWFAPEDLKTGDRFQERIEGAIRVFDKVLIVLSEASVKSRWVEREVNAARDREDRDNRTVLFPIRLDDAVMNAAQPWAADIRRTRHIGNFRDWHQHPEYRKAFDRLLRDLKASA